MPMDETPIPSLEDLPPAREVWQALAPGAEGLKPEVVPAEGGVLEVRLPLKPYPLRLGVREGILLFAEIRYPERRATLYLSRKRLAFNGRVPAEMLFALQRGYLPVLLPHLGGGRVPNLFLEARRKGIPLDWGRGFFHQRGRKGSERWLHLDPEEARLLVYTPGGRPGLQATRFPSRAALLRALPSLLLFPWDRHPPVEASLEGPLAALLLEEEVYEEELLALRAFSQELLRAYGRLLAAYPWARSFLPAFLPDGRTNPYRRNPPPLPDPGEEARGDPFLEMTAFWDGLALDLSWGRVDLLPLAPAPLRVREGWLLYTPSWAALLPG